MSYDIYLRANPKTCPTCSRSHEEPDLPDPTYNLTEIFDLALTGEPMPNPGVSEALVVLFGAATDRPRGLRLIGGHKARDTLGTIQRAIARLNSPAEERAFRALEPSNRWGTLEDAREVMASLLEAAEQFPEHVWEIR